MQLDDLKYPLVAILRGLKPEETEATVGQLIEAGIQAIEIPLNSPSPFQSIEIAAKLAGPDTLIGAGTVLEPEDVDRLHDAGGGLMVSPNVAPATLTRAVNLGMVTMPGVFTATEALLAAKLGASALKFFPAFKLGPDGIAAIKAILPKDARVAAVGGVSEANFGEYLAEGIEFFGLGSSLYKPGRSPEDVGARARSIVKAYEAAKSSLAA
jgi:2-dehydro-3-deoxyphosphogalactonate aldolase